MLKAGPPTITTAASPDITLGAGALSDSATVTGLVNPPASTVTFRLYAPADTACAGPPAFTSTVTHPAIGGAVTSGVVHTDPRRDLPMGRHLRR